VSPPDVSVVIVVKDDPRVLDCVDRVLDQDADFEFEVVVAVDDDPADATPGQLHDAYDGNDRVRILETTGNQAEAWNTSARSCKADVIVRIDSDAVPLDGWLSAIATPVLEGRAEWAAGPVEGVHTDNLVARYFHHRTEAYCRRFEQAEDLTDAVPSWNVAYERQALEDAGFYDPWLTASEDWDLHKRLARAGARGTYEPTARVLHHHPETFGVFASKEAWYTVGQYQMMLKHGLAPMLSAFVLPAAYAAVIGLLVSGAMVPLVGVAGLGLLGIMLVWHAIGGLRESDPAWYLRPLFRPIEGIAGLYGLVRGILRYGFSVDTHGETVGQPSG
jgi:glycosyltransferase involved in cell wall biosynthesis